MGKYQRKSKRGSYSKDKLREAIREVECGRMSGYSASKMYQIPRMTIMDHVHKKRTKSQTLGRNTALSPEIEFKLATSLHVMEKYGFGLSRKEVLQMVGDYVNQNDLITPFKNGIPGKDWFLAFKERHGLSMKKPQAVEFARKRAVDPFIINPYFDLLEKTISDLNLTYKPSAIWNVDETSFSKDPSKTKIVGAKGHAATRVISSPGRDNTTVLLGASASGEKTPPLIVYKGKNVWDTWTSSEAYPGTSYAATKNGWMETEVFEAFFKKTFLPAVQHQRPVLLIYDGHSTHVGLNIIEEARKENITIMKLPPHSSHILQPLDIAVMKSFKDRWDPLLVRWQRLNVGSVMPKSEFARLIGQIWAEIDPQVLRNGFRKSGIYPVNREEIKENQFDSLKLRHWREYEGSRNLVQEDEPLKRNPKSLLTLVLNFFNDIPMRENLEVVVVDNNLNESLENHTRDQKITFEELLLEKVKRGESSPKPRRRKVAPGAEVITHNDVLEKMREEQRHKAKTHINKNLRKGKKDTQSQSSPKINDDVVYLANALKNDCQLRPFSAKDISNLPACLQKKKPNSSKIKIISNLVIKQANTEEEVKVFNTRNQKYYKTAKVLNTKIQQRKKVKPSSTRKDQVFDSENLYENPKPGPSGLCRARYRRRSSSTTSVSGTISSHSDSEVMEIVSDSTLYNDEENCSNSLQTFNILKNIDAATDVTPEIDHDNEDVFYTGDDVLVNSTNSLPQNFNVIEDIDAAIDFTPYIDHDNEDVYYAGDEFLVNSTKSLPQTLDIIEDINAAKNFIPDVDHTNEDQQVTTYYVGDDVLVRYHVRQKWTYYVGRIENIKIIDEEHVYSVRFYKTIKKPKLTFRMTKKFDRDDVPAILIVKKIDLTQDPITLNYFFMHFDEDSVYF